MVLMISFILNFSYNFFLLFLNATACFISIEQLKFTETVKLIQLTYPAGVPLPRSLDRSQHWQNHFSGRNPFRIKKAFFCYFLRLGLFNTEKKKGFEIQVRFTDPGDLKIIFIS